MNRDYTYLTSTRTLCPVCRSVMDGKIVHDDHGVHVLRRCPDHGVFKELLESDLTYHLKKSEYDKPGTASTCQTDVSRGCPFDCGLCPEHDQHTCIGLIEVTRRCDLGCPTCFARAGAGRDLPLAQIERMMDFHLAAEGGKAEILQISGGEPTMHPDILEILRMARRKNFGYVMLNTNGLRIAEDPAFVEALSEFRGGFEVYLQFDGLDDDIYRHMRGRPLLAVKQRAVEQLSRYRVPTTLVCTVETGVNDQQIGNLLFYGMQTPCVRGVNFQPLAYFGRLNGQEDDIAPDADQRAKRATLSGILQLIERQTSRMMRADDFMPLPCDVERVAITYLLKQKGSFVPITRGRDMRPYKHFFNNTFLFTFEDTLSGLKDENGSFEVGGCCDLVRDLKKALRFRYLFKSEAEQIQFVDENTFRISVSSFVDLYNFDLKSMQKECVHIITPDLKRIPFSSFNMLYRSRYDADYT